MFKGLFSNWKTLVSGVVATTGAWFAHQATGTAQLIGTFITMLGTLLLGASAKDASNNNSGNNSGNK